MAGRRETRLALDEPARLAPNEWSSIEIRLLECTARGFRATGELALKVGAQVMLEVPGIGWVRAFVTWRRKGEFAASFMEPIALGSARFMSINPEVRLARLLGERAAAYSAGRKRDEHALRGRILEGLPVKTLDITP
jgi:hypothetical protein